MNSIVCWWYYIALPPLLITTNRGKGKDCLLLHSKYINGPITVIPPFSRFPRFAADKLRALVFFSPFFSLHSNLPQDTKQFSRNHNTRCTHTMRLYLSTLGLLTIVAVAGVAFGSPLALLLTNTPYTWANVESSMMNRLMKDDIKSNGIKKSGFMSTWTRILQNPPDSLEVAIGSRVELQCEVAGNPPPQVYWITGNEPERQIQELITRAQEASNTISTEWEGVSQVSSTYVIDCVRPEDQGLKYCVSVSKNTVAQSAATVLLVNTTRTTACNSENPPTIILHSSWRFALQRSTVILPCRVTGQPMPYLFWIDNAGNTISPASHERHTVLPNGDLQITDLQWSDMGEFTCKVQSGYTEKSVTTFLYPEDRQTENPI